VDGIQDIRDYLPTISPNLMLPFARWGINPFEDRFEVTLHNDGTIRGTGGVRVVRDDCATSVPGLYVAGDVATRELVAGATLRRRRPELRVGIVLGALGRPRRGQLRPQPRSTFRTPHTDWRSWIATAWHRLRERYARHGPGRQGRADCQTCFMCELYCKFDALYVAPDCDLPTRVDAATLLASGLLGQFRRDSGWDEWHGQYPNEHRLMDGVFRRAREATPSAD
jgi:hypothetical protein